MLHKVEDKRRLSTQIEEHLRKNPEVRPFPAAVTRLSAACQDREANAQRFESIIECDPGLSVKILRLANSPLFCPSGEVKSVAHAVALLGLRKLKSLAMSVAGARMFASGDAAKEQRQKLWSHSVGCAVVARTLAGHVANIDADDAFLAGVFHDVGKLMFYDVFPADYAALESSFIGVDLVEEEQFVIGTTHEKVGLASAEAWELPDEIKAAIGWHHHPEEASICSEFAAAIGLADRMAKNWGIGSKIVPIPDLQAEACDAYGLTEEQFNAIAATAEDAFEETMVASTD